MKNEQTIESVGEIKPSTSLSNKSNLGENYHKKNIVK